MRGALRRGYQIVEGRRSSERRERENREREEDASRRGPITNKRVLSSSPSYFSWSRGLGAECVERSRVGVEEL